MKLAILSNSLQYTFRLRGELIKAILAKGHQVAAVGPDDSPIASRNLRELGAEVIPVRLQKNGMNPFAELVLLLRLWGVLRRLEPDCVVAYTAKALVWGTIAAALSGVRRRYAVVTGRGSLLLEGSGIRRRMIQTLYRLALRLNRRVVFQNSRDITDFRETGIIGRAQQVALVRGSGVNLAEYGFREHGEGPTTMLFVGRILADKGVREFVEAAKILRPEFPEVRFILAGPLDTNPTAIDEREIAEWENEGIVEYVGAVDDVRELLANCTALVLPSYGEGLSRAVLEAKATGRAVITSDAPGCGDSIVHGVEGFVVPVRTVLPLAEAMRRLIVDRALARQMGRHARANLSGTFDSGTVTARMLAALEIS